MVLVVLSRVQHIATQESNCISCIVGRFFTTLPPGKHKNQVTEKKSDYKIYQVPAWEEKVQ